MSAKDFLREKAVSTWTFIDKATGFSERQIARAITPQSPSGPGFQTLLHHTETRPKAHWPVACAEDPVSLDYRRKQMAAAFPNDVEWHSGVICLEQAKVDLKYGLHKAPAGIVMAHLCGNQTLRNPRYSLPLLRLPWRKAQATHAQGIMLLPAWHHNFYHWIIDILPRLSLLDEAGLNAPLILPANASGFVRKTLQMLERDFIQLDTDVHQFEQLYLPTAMSPSLDISKSKLAFLRNHVLPAAQTANPTPGPKRFYISRGDANIRRVANEAELLPGLKARGFEIIVPSQLSVAEQMTTFAQADFILGPHGAGFANLAFAQTGTKVIEFFYKGHFSPSYYRIAESLSCPYGLVVAQPTGQDLHVDPTELFTLIDQLDEGTSMPA